MTHIGNCELLQKLEEAWRRGDIHQMPSLHQQHLAFHNTSHNSDLCVARSHYRMGEYGKCIQRLGSCITHPTAKILLAKSFWQLGWDCKAFEYAKSVLDDERSSKAVQAEAYEIMAYVYRIARCQNESLSMALKCLMSEPNIGYRCLWRLRALDKVFTMPEIVDCIDGENEVYNLLVELTNIKNSPYLRLDYLNMLQRLGILDNLLSIFYIMYSLYIEIGETKRAESLIEELKSHFPNSFHPYYIRHLYRGLNSIPVYTQLLKETIQEIEAGLSVDSHIPNLHLCFALVQLYGLQTDREFRKKSIHYLDYFIKYICDETEISHKIMNSPEHAYIIATGALISRKVGWVAKSIRYLIMVIRKVRYINDEEEHSIYKFLCESYLKGIVRPKRYILLNV